MPETPKRRVLVAEDDGDVQLVVRLALEREGMKVDTASDGPTALEKALAEPLDVLVLDLDLPGLDGLDVLEGLRATSDVPVIIVTGRRGEGDRVLGLDLGADDYVIKPFSTRELAARIRTVLRRGRTAGAAPLTFGDLTLEVGSRQVQVAGHDVELSRLEFDLLLYLARAPRRAFSREELLRGVWRSSGEWQTVATVTEHVRRLRQKLEPAADDRGHIRTVRGVGYLFEPDPQAA
jgi:two-component system, OmpR family, phosphate regulon response regulator PhoB